MSAAPFPFRLERAGTVMTPDPARSDEAEGVLNPASAQTPSGETLLFPRLVATGNRSTIGLAELRVGQDGVPSGVDRRTTVLRPDRTWEQGSTHGGVEDPRITRLDDLGLWVMAYVAYGPLGPRPALAMSADLAAWTRLGPLRFEYSDEQDLDLDLFPNKDVVLFPEPVSGPDGAPSYALLHRPVWDFSFARPGEIPLLPAAIRDDRPSVWISYVPVAEARADPRALTRARQHTQLAAPEFAWEHLKIGAGAPPVRVPQGWLLLYHGVSGEVDPDPYRLQTGVRYSAGAMILDLDDPRIVRARSERPLLEPSVPEERSGIVANVVFPTASEMIGGRRFVFYGMADARIGVAELLATD